MSSRSLACVFILMAICYVVLCTDTFKNCNRYTSFGYGYRDFFEYKETSPHPNEVFHLEFYVKTASDAHLLLKSEVTGDDGFEIVIGAGSNTFSQIRLVGPEGRSPMMTQKTENYLSANDYQQFWISMDMLGVISVGRNDEVFLNWRFDNPFPIKYFSFGSWTNNKADWRFGCKKQADTDVTEENAILTPLRKLKNDLFTLYDPNALPVSDTQTLEVKVNFQATNVQLDEKRGELSMYGYGDLRWLDAKIRWKPEDYNGIQDIYIPPFQIWTPNIRVLNSQALDKASLFDLTAAGVVARYDGSIFWRPPFKSVSSCTVNLRYWPSDVHNCSVYLGFWMKPSNLMLTMMDEYLGLSINQAGSEWEILEDFPLNSATDEDENYGILYVELRRLQGTQALLFTAPYFAAVMMSLVSFWVSPYSSYKLHLSCGSVVVQLAILFLIGQCVPAMTESVPRIIELYSWSTVTSCIPIALFVMLKNIHLSFRIPEPVLKLLSHNLLNFVFCLPEVPEVQTEYANLNDDENKAQRYRLNSLRLITTIERLFFLGYLIVLLLLHTLI